MEGGVAVFQILLEAVAGGALYRFGRGISRSERIFWLGLFFFVKTVVDESFYRCAGIVGIVTDKFH